MSTGQDEPSTSANEKREGERLSPSEPTHPTMRQSGTFEAFGNAEQRLYVRSGSRLATEIQSDFGTATYWSTFESGDGSSRRGNMRVKSLTELQSQDRADQSGEMPMQSNSADKPTISADKPTTSAEMPTTSADKPTQGAAEMPKPSKTAETPTQPTAQLPYTSGSMQGVASAPEPLITVLHESTTVVDKVPPPVDLNTLDFDELPAKPSSQRKEDRPAPQSSAEPSHNQDLLSLIQDLQRQMQQLEMRSKREQSLPAEDGRTVGVTGAHTEPIKDLSSTEREGPMREDLTSSVTENGNAAKGGGQASVQDQADGILNAFSENLAAMQTATIEADKPLNANRAEMPTNAAETPTKPTYSPISWHADQASPEPEGEDEQLYDGYTAEQWEEYYASMDGDDYGDELSPEEEAFLDGLEEQYETDWTKHMPNAYGFVTPIKEGEQNTASVPAAQRVEPEPHRYDDSKRYTFDMPQMPGTEFHPPEEKPASNANASAGPAAPTMPAPASINIPGLEALPQMIALLGKSIETTQKDMIETRIQATDAQKQMNELLEKRQAHYDETDSKIALVIGNEHAMMEKIEKALQSKWIMRLAELRTKFDLLSNYLAGVMPKKGQGKICSDGLMQKVDELYRPWTKLRDEDRPEWLTELRIKTPDDMKQFDGPLLQVKSITKKYWPEDWTKSADDFARKTDANAFGWWVYLLLQMRMDGDMTSFTDVLDVRKVVESPVGYSVGVWKEDLEEWWDLALTLNKLKHIDWQPVAHGMQQLERKLVQFVSEEHKFDLMVFMRMEWPSLWDASEEHCTKLITKMIAFAKKRGEAERGTSAGQRGGNTLSRDKSDHDYTPEEWAQWYWQEWQSESPGNFAELRNDQAAGSDEVQPQDQSRADTRSGEEVRASPRDGTDSAAAQEEGASELTDGYTAEEWEEWYADQGEREYSDVEDLNAFSPADFAEFAEIVGLYPESQMAEL